MAKLTDAQKKALISAAASRGVNESREVSVFANVNAVKDEIATPKAGETVSTLQLNSIQPDPDQSRRTFPPEEISSLAETIKASGLIQPIIVRRLGSSAIDGYMIVSGERRWRAHQLLGMPTIKAIVRDMDLQTVRFVQFIENYEGARSSVSPVEEALHIQRLKETTGLNQDIIAARLGVEPDLVAKRLSLLTLQPEIREALQSKAIADVESARVLNQIWLISAADGARLLGRMLTRSVSRDELQIALRDLESKDGGVARPKGKAGRKPTQLPDWLASATGASEGRLAAKFTPAKEEGGMVRVTLIGTEAELKGWLSK